MWVNKKSFSIALSIEVFIKNGKRQVKRHSLEGTLPICDNMKLVCGLTYFKNIILERN